MLALRGDRLGIRELKGRARGGCGPLSDEDLPRGCALPEPRCDVHGVARDEGASPAGHPDHDLARVDADPELELVAEQVAKPGAHRDGRVERSLGVVLVGDRHAVHRQHGVSCELLDRASGGLDLLRHCVVETVEQESRVLGVRGRRHLRRSDEIGEEQRRDLPLARHRGAF